MTLNINSLPSQNPNYELTELDSEVILFSVAHEKAVYFNSTAQLIWHLCDGQHSIASLTEGLQEQYPGEADIESQVLTALEKMIEDKVITLLDTPCA